MTSVTLVVLVCRMLGTLGDLEIPVCHEEIVGRANISIRQCLAGNQQVIESWKELSKFRGETWEVTEIRCESGDYQRKDAI